MKTQYQYINFVKVADKPKTSVWSCRNTRSDDELGEVRWYPAWRKYCFFPTVQAVYSVGCLNDIEDFIRHLSNNAMQPMGVKQLEAAILAELKGVAQNNKLRQKDIMEWQTGQSLKAQDGETLYYLPSLGVSVAVKVPVKLPNNAMQPTRVRAADTQH